MLSVPFYSLLAFLSIAFMSANHSLYAQLPRQGGFSEPDSSQDLPKPNRASDSASSRRDRSAVKLPAKSKSGSIRQTSAYEGDDERPPSPFQLDEPLFEVVIEGNSTIPETEIAKHIKTRAGRIVTQKQIKDDVDALVRTRWFASVEP